MKILHTSDWHLGKTLNNITRYEEQQEFIDEIAEIAKDENVDIILISGDIYDTSNPSAMDILSNSRIIKVESEIYFCELNQRIHSFASFIIGLSITPLSISKCLKL